MATLGNDDDALKEEARELLLRLDAGSALKYRQSANGCGFWFLDGSSIAENGPWELVGKRLIAGGAPGSEAPLAITERGRAVAARLRGFLESPPLSPGDESPG